MMTLTEKKELFVFILLVATLAIGLAVGWTAKGK